MIVWLLAAHLCGAIVATWPEVAPERACVAALAIEAERGAYPAELVAAIAWRESRFEPSAVNARTGCWGVMQVSARGRTLDVRRQVRAGVRKLDEARAYCARSGEPTWLCALAGYASGPAGVRGRWYRGPRRVLREAGRLRANTAPRTWRGKAES